MKLSVGVKISAISIVMLAVVIAAAALSVRLLGEVEEELDYLAHRQIPALDEVSRLSTRIFEQSVAPPPEDWDGVWQAAEK